jgi:hypothetical protein
VLRIWQICLGQSNKINGLDTGRKGLVAYLCAWDGYSSLTEGVAP